VIIEHQHSVVFSRTCRLVSSTGNTTTRVSARQRKTQAVKVGEDMGDAQGEEGGASWADRLIQR
jgi:hypothetical protein